MAWIRELSKRDLEAVFTKVLQKEGWEIIAAGKTKHLKRSIDLKQMPMETCN